MGGPPIRPAFARIVEEGANRVVVEAGSDVDGGYLVLLDSYSDDWRVQVDGQPAMQLRANGLFRSIRIASGRHIIEFTYRPLAFIWGALISVGTFLVLTGLLWFWPTRALGANDRVHCQLPRAVNE